MPPLEVQLIKKDSRQLLLTEINYFQALNQPFEFNPFLDGEEKFFLNCVQLLCGRTGHAFETEPAPGELSRAPLLLQGLL